MTSTRRILMPPRDTYGQAAEAADDRSPASRQRPAPRHRLRRVRQPRLRLGPRFEPRLLDPLGPPRFCTRHKAVVDTLYNTSPMKPLLARGSVSPSH